MMIPCHKEYFCPGWSEETFLWRNWPWKKLWSFWYLNWYMVHNRKVLIQGWMVLSFWGAQSLLSLVWTLLLSTISPPLRSWRPGRTCWRRLRVAEWSWLTLETSSASSAWCGTWCCGWRTSSAWSRLRRTPGKTLIHKTWIADAWLLSNAFCQAVSISFLFFFSLICVIHIKMMSWDRKEKILLQFVMRPRLV